MNKASEIVEQVNRARDREVDDLEKQVEILEKRFAEVVQVLKFYYCTCQSELYVRRRERLLEEVASLLPEARPAQSDAARSLGHCPAHPVSSVNDLPMETSEEADVLKIEQIRNRAFWSPEIYRQIAHYFRTREARLRDCLARNNPTPSICKMLGLSEDSTQLDVESSLRELLESSKKALMIVRNLVESGRLR